MKKKILLFALAFMMVLVLCAQFVSAEEPACTEGSHNIAAAATPETTKGNWVVAPEYLIDGDRLTAGGSSHGHNESIRTLTWSHPQVLSKLVFVVGAEDGQTVQVAGPGGKQKTGTQSFTFRVRLFDAEGNQIFEKSQGTDNQIEIVIDLAEVTTPVAKVEIQNMNYWNNGQFFCEVEAWSEGHGYKEISDTATCTEPGTKTYECIICQNQVTADSAPHGHTAAADWSVDAEKGTHYKACTVEGCDGRVDEAEHEYTAECDINCDVCKQDTRTVADDVAHVFASDCDTTCDVCSTKRTTETPHIYDKEGVEGEDNLYVDCDTTCDLCGEERTAPHVYEWICDNTCAYCDATRDVTHTFDNECDTQCNICTFTREFKGHVYDSFIDPDCNYCGVKQPVMTTGTLTHAEYVESAVSYYATKYEQKVDENGNLVYEQKKDADGNLEVDDEGNPVYDETKPVYDMTKPLEPEVAPGVAAENAAAGNLMDGITKTAGLYAPGSDWYCIEQNGYVLITLKEPTDILSLKIYGCGNWCEFNIKAYDAEGNEVISYNNFMNGGYGDDAQSFVAWAADSFEGAKEVKTIKVTSISYKWNDPKTLKISEIEMKTHVHAYNDICLDDACKDCGETREVPGHIFGAENACDITCNRCGQTIGETDKVHVYDGDTVDEEGNLVIGCDRFCNVCGDERTGTKSHTYDQTKNGINICDDLDCNICGEARESVHEYDNDCDAMCNKCESLREVVHTYKFSCATECMVCGTARTGEIHQWTGTCDMRICEACASMETNECTYDNACDTTCNVCGATRTVGDHAYTNACDTTCDNCGATRTITHTYANACDAVCDVCGVAREVPAHVYANACDAECDVCKATREVAAHVYDNACDTACNVCGETREVAAHVYDNACDAACNVCSATRTPSAHVYDNGCDATCNVCNVGRTVSAHKYGEWTVTAAATKDAKGSQTRTCAECKTVETVEIPQLDGKIGGATIAAIVVGCVAIVAVIGAAAYYFLVIKKKSV